jgi:hypothetical protein
MITAYTGLPGAGKTLSMTLQACELWKIIQVPVFANYSVRFPINKPKKKLIIDWRHFQYWYESEEQKWYYPRVITGSNFLPAFKQVDNAIFLIDECGTVFDNRSWKEFDKSTMARFRESRKTKLEIFYTAQDIMDVDIKIRKLTNYEVKCEFIKFLFKFDVGLKNDRYHQEVIRSDTVQTRERFKAGYTYFFPFQFQKAYKWYNTMERIKYEIPESETIDKLILPNKWETGEFHD